MGVIKCKHETKKLSSADFCNVKNEKKIIAVDFDGTLCFNKYPIISNPNKELIDFIKANREKYIWILWTCREGKQLKFATDWLKEQGIEFDYVNENSSEMKDKFGNDCRKVFADFYIDDKNKSWKELIGD